MAAEERFDLKTLPLNWDAEAPLYRFECIIDTVEKIADGLQEDRTTQNALNCVHEQLCGLYKEFEDRLMN